MKPLTSVESQFANSSHSVKDIRIQGNAPGKIKVWCDMNNTKTTFVFEMLHQSNIPAATTNQILLHINNEYTSETFRDMCFGPILPIGK